MSRRKIAVWRNGEGKSSVNVGDDDTDAWRRKADDDHLQQEDCYREEQAEAGPPSRTRARLKRKLQLQQQQPQPQPLPNNLNKPKQVIPKKLNHEHQSTSNVDKRLADKAKKSPKSDVHPTSSTTISQPSAQPLPQKHILELILDTLQRRDTYEIFAEPVDPEEVEDYYDIIKEPMDFGTMRAKLHEGMYTTLEQFEHDVFLISGNAMHFNSSATIFFRQARSIHELSKKLFHVLKTDPENFVLEFSGTRRRSCRRPQVEAKNLNCKSIPRHSSNVRPGSATIDASSRGAPNSFNGPSIFKTSFLGNLGFASTAAHGLDFGFSFASGDGRTSSFDEADRRYTYKPKMLFEHDHHSYVSGAPAEPKTLVPAVNQQDMISYSESLMCFVKDLGPTAQMVAKRKLQGLSGDSSTSNETPTSDCRTQPPPTAQTASLFPFLQTRPSTQNFIPSQKSHNLPLASPTVPKQTGNVIDLTNADEEENNVYNERFRTRGGMNFEDYSRRDKVTQKRWSGIQFGSHYSSSNNGDVVSSGISHSSNLSESSSSKSKAVAPAVPSEQSNASELKLRNKNSSISSASCLSKTVQVSSLSRNIGSKHSSDSATQDVTLMKSSNVANNSAQESSFMEPREVMPSTSRFTFDLPFLKSQLSQMKFTNNDDNRFLQSKPQPADFATSPEPRDKKKNMSFTKKVEQKGWPFRKNQPLSSFDNPLDTDLALQL